MWDGVFKPTVIILGAMLLIWFLLAFSCYLYTVNIGESNLVKITSGEEIIYQGKQAYVEEESGGMTTTITIYKQLFPFYAVDKKYSSPDIKIVPLKKDY